MPAGPPPSCGRLPAPVPRHSTAFHGPCRLTEKECLRAATRPTGRRARTRSLRSGRPPGAPRRLRGACGVASRCPAPPACRHRHGHLARAIGHGCCPRYRLTVALPPCLRIGETLSKDDGRPRPPPPPLPRPGAAGARRPAPARRRGRATWLILPVVICLSQRLSHACASMN